MTRPEYQAHRERMDKLRESFVREWNAEHQHLPESKEKAMKMLRDWQGVKGDTSDQARAHFHGEALRREGR